MLTAKKCRVWLLIPKRMWIEVGHPKTWRLWPAKTKHIDPYLPGKPISHRHFQEEQMFEFHLNFQMFILFRKQHPPQKLPWIIHPDLLIPGQKLQGMPPGAPNFASGIEGNICRKHGYSDQTGFHRGLSCKCSLQPVAKWFMGLGRKTPTTTLNLGFWGTLINRWRTLCQDKHDVSIMNHGKENFWSLTAESKKHPYSVYCNTLYATGASQKVHFSIARFFVFTNSLAPNDSIVNCSKPNMCCLISILTLLD